MNFNKARPIASIELSFVGITGEWWIDHLWLNPEFGMMEAWGRIDHYEDQQIRQSGLDILKKAFSEFSVRTASPPPEVTAEAAVQRRKIPAGRLLIGVTTYIGTAGDGFWLVSPMSPAGKGYRGYQCMPKDMIQLPEPVSQSALIEALDKACSFLRSQREKANLDGKR